MVLWVGGLFIHIKQSAAGAILKSLPPMSEVIYYWAKKAVRGKCVEDGGFWSRIGCNRSRGWRIFADGNKRSSYVFLAIWIPLQCNFTGKPLLSFLFISSKCCLHTHTHKNGFFLVHIFLYLVWAFLYQKHSCLSWLLWQLFFVWRFFCCWTQISICTHPCPITLNYEWTHVFFPDDNRHECHILLTSEV